MVQIRYNPDDETLQGVITPPQNDQEGAEHTEKDPDSSGDDAADEDTEEEFHSPAGSPRSQTSNNDSPSESSPQPQEGPSNKQDKDPNADTVDQDPDTDTIDPNIGGNLSRGARGRAPVRRQRSLSHPPTKKQLKAAKHVHD